MIYSALLQLSLYLSITVIIEVAVVFLLGYRKRNFLIIICLANVITNPTLNILITLYSFIMQNQIPIYLVFLLEVAIVFVEFFILFSVFKSKYAKKELFMISSIINSSSFLIGYIIQDILVNLY